MSVAFDTLAYANKLKSVGFEAKQAETIVEMQADIIENNIATKSDLKELAGLLEKLTDTIEKRFATKHDLAELETRLAELEARLTIRFGVMLAAAVTILAVLIKLK